MISGVCTTLPRTNWVGVTLATSHMNPTSCQPMVIPACTHPAHAHPPTPTRPCAGRCAAHESLVAAFTDIHVSRYDRTCRLCALCAHLLAAFIALHERSTDPPLRFNPSKMLAHATPYSLTSLESARLWCPGGITGGITLHILLSQPLCMGAAVHVLVRARKIMLSIWSSDRLQTPFLTHIFTDSIPNMAP